MQFDATGLAECHHLSDKVKDCTTMQKKEKKTPSNLQFQILVVGYTKKTHEA